MFVFRKESFVAVTGKILWHVKAGPVARLILLAALLSTGYAPMVRASESTCLGLTDMPLVPAELDFFSVADDSTDSNQNWGDSEGIVGSMTYHTVAGGYAAAYAYGGTYATAVATTRNWLQFPVNMPGRPGGLVGTGGVTGTGSGNGAHPSHGSDPSAGPGNPVNPTNDHYHNQQGRGFPPLLDTLTTNPRYGDNGGFTQITALIENAGGKPPLEDGNLGVGTVSKIPPDVTQDAKDQQVYFATVSYSLNGTTWQAARFMDSFHFERLIHVKQFKQYSGTQSPWSLPYGAALGSVSYNGQLRSAYDPIIGDSDPNFGGGGLDDARMPHLTEPPVACPNEALHAADAFRWPFRSPVCNAPYGGGDPNNLTTYPNRVGWPRIRINGVTQVSCDLYGESNPFGNPTHPACSTTATVPPPRGQIGFTLNPETGLVVLKKAITSVDIVDAAYYVENRNVWTTFISDPTAGSPNEVQYIVTAYDTCGNTVTGNRVVNGETPNLQDPAGNANTDPWGEVTDYKGDRVDINEDPVFISAGNPPGIGCPRAMGAGTGNQCGPETEEVIELTRVRVTSNPDDMMFMLELSANTDFGCLGEWYPIEPCWFDLFDWFPPQSSWKEAWKIHVYVLRIETFSEAKMSGVLFMVPGIPILGNFNYYIDLADLIGGASKAGKVSASATATECAPAVPCDPEDCGLDCDEDTIMNCDDTYPECAENDDVICNQPAPPDPLEGNITIVQDGPQLYFSLDRLNFTEKDGAIGDSYYDMFGATVVMHDINVDGLLQLLCMLDYNFDKLFQDRTGTLRYFPGNQNAPTANRFFETDLARKTVTWRQDFTGPKGIVDLAACRGRCQHESVPQSNTVFSYVKARHLMLRWTEPVFNANTNQTEVQDLYGYRIYRAPKPNGPWNLLADINQGNSDANRGVSTYQFSDGRTFGELGQPNCADGNIVTGPAPDGNCDSATYGVIPTADLDPANFGLPKEYVYCVDDTPQVDLESGLGNCVDDPGKSIQSNGEAFFYKVVSYDLSQNVSSDSNIAGSAVLINNDRPARPQKISNTRDMLVVSMPGGDRFKITWNHIATTPDVCTFTMGTTPNDSDDDATICDFNPVDNDNDGQINEDIRDGADNDNDGKFDEDGVEFLHGGYYLYRCLMLDNGTPADFSDDTPDCTKLTRLIYDKRTYTLASAAWKYRWRPIPWHLDTYLDDNKFYDDDSDNNTTLNSDGMDNNADGVTDDGYDGIDEDPIGDRNSDGCSGLCNVDDDLDGFIDEANPEDDDEDGQVNEDGYHIQSGRKFAYVIRSVDARYHGDPTHAGLPYVYEIFSQPELTASIALYGAQPVWGTTADDDADNPSRRNNSRDDDSDGLTDEEYDEITGLEVTGFADDGFPEPGEEGTDEDNIEAGGSTAQLDNDTDLPAAKKSEDKGDIGDPNDPIMNPPACEESGAALVDNDFDGDYDEDPVDTLDNDNDGLTDEDGPNDIFTLTGGYVGNCSSLLEAIDTAPAGGDPNRITMATLSDTNDPPMVSGVKIAGDLSNSGRTLTLSWDPIDLTVEPFFKYFEVHLSRNHCGYNEDGDPPINNDLAFNDVLFDEDPPGDFNGDGKPGFGDVDDDGDGKIDEDAAGKLPTDPAYVPIPNDDDEDGRVDEDGNESLDEDLVDGVDNDGDGMVDEDGCSNNAIAGPFTCIQDDPAAAGSPCMKICEVHDPALSPSFYVARPAGSPLDCRNNYQTSDEQVSFEINNLQPGVTYFFKVRAVDLAGNKGPLSVVATNNPVDNKVPTDPLKPQVLPVAEGTKLRVIWQPPVVNDFDIETYNLYRGLDTGGGPSNATFTKINVAPIPACNLGNEPPTGCPCSSAQAGVPGYNPMCQFDTIDMQDTGLQDGKTYYYKLTTMDKNSNEGAFSAITLPGDCDGTLPNACGVPTDITPTSAPVFTYNNNKTGSEKLDLEGGVKSENPGGGSLTITWVSNKTRLQDLNLFSSSTESDLVGYFVERQDDPPAGAYTRLDADPEAAGVNSYPEFNCIDGLCKFVDTGLVDGKTYNYRVVAIDDAPVPNESVSTTQSGAPANIAPPATPTGMTLTALSGARIGVGWFANKELDLAGYRIYYSSTGLGGSFQKIGEVSPSVLTFTDTTATLNLQPRYYQISAFDTQGNESERTDVASIVATDADTSSPSPPLNFRAISGPNTTDPIVIQRADPKAAKLIWYINTEPDLTKYRIVRSDTGKFGVYSQLKEEPTATFCKVADTPQCSYHDKNLTAGVTYWYAILPIDTTGNVLTLDPENAQPAIPQDNADTKKPNVPMRPKNAVISPEGKVVRVVWTPLKAAVAADEAADLAGYLIYRDTNPNNPKATDWLTTPPAEKDKATLFPASTVIATLAPNQLAYTDWVDTTQACTLDSQCVVDPANAAVAVCDQVNKRCRTSNTAYFDDASVNNGTTYFYAVAGYDVNGNIGHQFDNSATHKIDRSQSGRPKDTGAPLPPSGLGPTPLLNDPHAINITWSLAPATRSLTQPPFNPPAPDTDGDGFPDLMEENYRGDKTFASLMPTLPSTVNGDYSFAGLTLVRANSKEGPWVAIDSNPSTLPIDPFMTQTSYTDTNLVSGQNYCYRIYSTDTAGLTSTIYGDEAKCAKPGKDTIAPSTPQNVLPIPLNGSVRLSWTPNTEPDLAGYNVYVCLGDESQCGPPATADNYIKNNSQLITVPFFTVPGLSNSLLYWFKVTAVDDAPASDGGPNESPRSVAVSTVPSEQAGQQALMRSISVKAGWNLIAAPMRQGQARFATASSATLFGFSSNRYQTAQEALAGAGYWLFSDQDTTVEFPGLPFEPSQILVPLTPGWNLVGHPFDRLVLGEEKIRFLAPGGTRATLTNAIANGWVRHVYGYSPEAGYVNLSGGGVLERGQAFWIEVAAPVSIEMSQ